ncbi:MAG: hypothetical protein ACKVI4_17880, partial [Actinomycetales bacterium]
LEAPIGYMVYQVLIVPRARPPPKQGRRRKSRAAGGSLVPPTTKGIAKVVDVAPAMARSLSRSSIATTATGSSTSSDCSDASSVSRASSCGSPAAAMQQQLCTK